MRRIGTSEVLEFPVSGAAPAAVGDACVLCPSHREHRPRRELVTLFWSNEVFDASDPDTFMEDVRPSGLAVSIVRPVVPLSIQSS